jgi:hypothetical protein
VGVLTLAPGEVTADVQGSRRTPYKVRIRIRQFARAEWDQVFDALAAEIGHMAALLDGELPPAVAEDVHSVGLDLLPGPGELQPRCSCPDWADPCKHAAAVCYLVADELDADPFGVLLLRGRGRDEVLGALRSRRAAAGPSRVPTTLEPAPDTGVPAGEAWHRPPGPLPVVPPPPQRPGQPTVLAGDPPDTAGVDLEGLRALAADAATRALALARGASSSGLELSVDEDLARRAAALLGGEHQSGDPDRFAWLARRAGIAPPELLRRALAYRDGGVQGLAVLTEAWDPGPSALDAGRALLGARVQVQRNRVTHGDRQLRFGRDGRWYPFRRDGRGPWSPDGPPLLPGDEVGELEEDLDDR